MGTNKSIKILVVEDDEADFFLLEIRLRKTSFQKEITWANSYEAAIEELNSETVDLVIVDYKLGAYTGLELVSYINDKFPFTPTILLTGLKAAAIDEEALKSGVYDYLAKDEYTVNDIDRSIRYAIEKSKVLKSLKESENKFKNLFENSVAYIFLIDSDHLVIDANKSALKLLRFNEKDEITGMNIADHISPKIFEFHTQEHTSVEIEFSIDKAEKKVFCILNSSIVDEEKNIHQLVLHDITERKLNEQKEKLLEKQVLTGKVARIIGHEIKNPLTSIHLSIAELRYVLEKTPAEQEDPEELLQIIERNARRIDMLLEDLLNATRFDTINSREFYLHDLLDETLLLVQDRVQLKKIVIKKNIHANLILIGDKEKLMIALLNVLVNAVEAVAEKESGRIQIATSFADKKVSIEIADNGKGIPEHDLHKLFEPFFTSKQGGTGLGLVATYNIIAKHDGSIKVKSETGKGTTFFISIPIEK
ncbi:MAG: response regulator [Bacteroidia bacterium]|nr:response regulator [Bacteroidia bacterium]